MGPEKRRQGRAAGYAKAVFVDTLTPGYLRDLSASGAQVAVMGGVSAQAGQTVTIEVIPVHDPAFAPFQLSFRVHWVKSGPVWLALGGQVRGVTPQDEESLGKLVEYYAGASRG
jgi:PilZ domain